MINSAQPELLTLAAAMRGEEWSDDLAGALIAAKNAGWDWPKAFVFAARLLADENALPRDLTEACRDPLRHVSQPGDVPPALETVLGEVRAKAAVSPTRTRGPES